MADLSFVSTSTPSRPRITGKSKSTSFSTERSDRKTLQTIQPSADLVKNILDTNHSGCMDSISKVKKFSSTGSHSSKSFASSIYKDTSTAIESNGVHCDRSAQTDGALLDSLLEEKQRRQLDASTDSGHQSGFLDVEAYELMANEVIPYNYWKDVAEERRLALAKTLEENKLLHEEIHELKMENGRLSELANKAEELQNLLNTVLSGDDSDDDEGTSNIQSSPDETNTVSDAKKDSIPVEESLPGVDRSTTDKS